MAAITAINVQRLKENSQITTQSHIPIAIAYPIISSTDQAKTPTKTLWAVPFSSNTTSHVHTISTERLLSFCPSANKVLLNSDLAEKFAVFFKKEIHSDTAEAASLITILEVHLLKQLSKEGSLKEISTELLKFPLRSPAAILMFGAGISCIIMGLGIEILQFSSKLSFALSLIAYYIVITTLFTLFQCMDNFMMMSMIRDICITFQDTIPNNINSVLVEGSSITLNSLKFQSNGFSYSCKLIERLQTRKDLFQKRLALETRWKSDLDQCLQNGHSAKLITFIEENCSEFKEFDNFLLLLKKLQ